MSRNYGGTMVADLFARFGADTTDYEKKMRSAVTRMLFAAESLTQAGRIMSTYVTAPMLAIGAASLKMAMDFDRSMTKIVTLVGVARGEVEKWKPSILDIAATTGRSATEMADALFFITSNGFRTTQALDILKSSAMGAAIGLGETKDIAFAATSAMNAYGGASMTANESVAILVKTVREGNLEASELPPVLGQLLPIAAAMGVEFHEVGAAIATMTRSGVSARLAALGMKSALIGLIAPTKAARDNALSMGFSMERMAQIAREEGLITALRQMDIHLKEAGRSWKTVFPNAKAFTAVLQLMGENAEATFEIFESLADTTGKDLTDTFDQVQGPAQEFAVALAKIKTAMVTLGGNLTPVVGLFDDVADAISWTSRSFDTLNPSVKGIISGFGTMLLTVGPLLYALGNLGRIMARFTGLSILFKAGWVENAAAIMAGHRAAQSATVSMKALNMSMMGQAGLIGAVGLAAWEFGRFLDELIGYTDRFNAKFGDFGKTHKEIASVMDETSSSTQQAALAAFDLAAKIGDLNLARQLEIAMQEKNMEVASQLISKINEKAAAYNREHIKIEGLTQAERDKAAQDKILKDAKDAEIAAQEESIKNLREEKNLMNREDVIEQLEQMNSEYINLLDNGVQVKDVNNAYAEKLKELLLKAKEFGIEINDGIKAMATSMREQGLVSWQELEDLLIRINSHVDATPGKIIPAMATVGDTIATSLRGGFGKGFEGALSDYEVFDARLKDQLNATWRSGFTGFGDAVRDEINQIIEESGPFSVKVTPDQVYWDRAMADTLAGNRPIT